MYLQILTIKGDDSPTNTYAMVVKQSKKINKKKAETKHTDFDVDNDDDDPPLIIPFDHTIPEPDIGEPLPPPTFKYSTLKASEAQEV